MRLVPEFENETSLRSAPVPVTASKYINGEATVDIGMAPYESWTGKRSRKHRCVAHTRALSSDTH